MYFSTSYVLGMWICQHNILIHCTTILITEASPRLVFNNGIILILLYKYINRTVTYNAGVCFNDGNIYYIITLTNESIPILIYTIKAIF